MRNHLEKPDRGADWPYSSLLFFGFFGADTPGGRRLLWHTVPALVLMGLSVSFQMAVPQLVPSILLGLALPLGVAWIGWAIARYLGSLDELSRAIQLKAFAFSYGAVAVIAAAAFSMLLTVPTAAEGFAVPALLLVVMAAGELVRGLALVGFARRYR